MLKNSEIGNNDQKRKEYSNLTSSSARNKAQNKESLREKIQKVNNYRLVNRDDPSPSGTITNIKDIPHKKWGIRVRHFDATPPVSSHEEKNKIIVKREPSIISNDHLNTTYNSKTSIPYNKKNSKYSNYSGNNVYISGSSQSNAISIANNGDNYQNNYTSYNQNTEPNIRIKGNKKSLVNKKNLTIPVIDRSSSVPSSHLRNNTSSLSIDETNKHPKQPYVLNVRKHEVIKHQARIKIKYNNSTTPPKDGLININNHSIIETKNVTKELKTIADAPYGDNIYHRYSYKYDPNISNIGSHSIDETNKKPKKEIVLAPRKNEVIKSTKPHKNLSKSPIQINLRTKLNLNGPDNKYVLYEPKKIKNKVEQKININKYEPKVNKVKYEPKMSKDKYEPRFNKEKYEPKVNIIKYEPKAYKDKYQPKVSRDKYQPKVSRE